MATISQVQGKRANSMIPLTEAFESAVDREKSVLGCFVFFFLSLSNTISSVLFSLKSNLNCFKVAKNLIA